MTMTELVTLERKARLTGLIIGELAMVVGIVYLLIMMGKAILGS